MIDSSMLAGELSVRVLAPKRVFLREEPLMLLWWLGRSRNIVPLEIELPVANNPLAKANDPRKFTGFDESIQL